ncbi:hypothetical protein BJY52DRAFT_444369 [Lactarius psammicola]|nr:hypothetical protein BJY52DRAFT_444369 [Lactarius psammicola]
MRQVTFEEYGFRGVYVAIQTILTLYAQGALNVPTLPHRLWHQLLSSSRLRMFLLTLPARHPSQVASMCRPVASVCVFGKG